MTPRHKQAMSTPERERQLENGIPFENRRVLLDGVLCERRLLLRDGHEDGRLRADADHLLLLIGELQCAESTGRLERPPDGLADS